MSCEHRQTEDLCLSWSRNGHVDAVGNAQLRQVWVRRPALQPRSRFASRLNDARATSGLVESLLLDARNGAETGEGRLTG